MLYNIEPFLPRFREMNKFKLFFFKLFGVYVNATLSVKLGTNPIKMLFLFETHFTYYTRRDDQR